MSTISVVFKGIAIGYVKEVSKSPSDSTKIDKHHVLFPFNECHSLKFSHQNTSVAQSPKIFFGHLGEADGEIKLSVTSPRKSATFESGFEQEVLDMTASTSGRETHSNISVKSNWNKVGVLMEIDDAEIRASSKYHDTDHIPYLVGGVLPKELTSLILEAKAIISLDSGEVLTVKKGNTVIFTSIPNNDFVLTFDNDCLAPTNGNDMEMIYELLTDPNDSSKKFYVECLHKVTGAKSSSTGIHDGKPCLFVHVSKADDLPTI